MVTKAIETAQRRVEGQNFDIRKQLLEYDNTMNRQREVIYEQRRRILEVVEEFLATFASKDLRPDPWDLRGLQEALSRQCAVPLTEGAWDTGLPTAPAGQAGDRSRIQEQVLDAFQRAYEAKRDILGPDVLAQLERTVLLSVMDAK